MKVVLCTPNEKAVITDVDDSLESMQSVVGGDIQMITPFEDDPEIAVIVNEDGKFCGTCEPNRAFAPNGEIEDVYFGTFFVCAARFDDEKFSSLTDEEAKKYQDYFLYPEVILNLNGRIVAAKLEDNEA